VLLEQDECSDHTDIVLRTECYRLIITAVIGWITDALSVMAAVTDFSLRCLAAQSRAGISVDPQMQGYTVSLSLFLSHTTSPASRSYVMVSEMSLRVSGTSKVLM